MTYKNKYRAIQSRCDCHPSTCNCMPYKIIMVDKNKEELCTICHGYNIEAMIVLVKRANKGSK